MWSTSSSVATCGIVLGLAFFCMLVFLILANVQLNAMDNQSTSINMTIDGRIDKALASINSFNMLKTYTLAVNVPKSLQLSSQDLINQLKLTTNGYNLYLSELTNGNLVPLTNVTSSFAESSIEFLVFKNIAAGAVFMGACAAGEAQFAIIGGQSFLVLQWIYGGSLGDFASLLNGELIVALVSMKIENMVSAQGARKYALQQTVFDFSSYHSLSEVLNSPGVSSNGYSIMSVLGY